MKKSSIIPIGVERILLSAPGFDIAKAMRDSTFLSEFALAEPIVRKGYPAIHLRGYFNHEEGRIYYVDATIYYRVEKDRTKINKIRESLTKYMEGQNSRIHEDRQLRL